MENEGHFGRVIHANILLATFVALLIELEAQIL